MQARKFGANSRVFSRVVDGRIAPIIFFVDRLSIPPRTLGPLLEQILVNGGLLSPSAGSSNVNIILGCRGAESTLALVTEFAASHRPVLHYLWCEECVREGAVLGPEERSPWAGCAITAEEEVNDSNDEREIARELEWVGGAGPAIASTRLSGYEAHPSGFPITPPISPVRERVLPSDAFAFVSLEQASSQNWDERISPMELDYVASPASDDASMKSRSPSVELSPDTEPGLPARLTSPELVPSSDASVPSMTVMRRSARLNDGDTTLIQFSPTGKTKGKVLSPKKARTRPPRQKKLSLLKQSQQYSDADFSHIVDYLADHELMFVPSESTNASLQLWRNFAQTAHGNGHTALEWEAYAKKYNLRITDELLYRLKVEDHQQDEVVEERGSRWKGKGREEQRGEGSRRARFASAV